jgi:hypothetical protein
MIILWSKFVTLTLLTCALSDFKKTSFRIRFWLECKQISPELRIINLQAKQIFHHTFRFSLHTGHIAIYISYTLTPFHKMLLHSVQNNVGDFSDKVGMSNFKEKHFLREVMITHLAKMFSALRESRIFIGIHTRNFHDPIRIE